jgi:hypothetical protein
MEILHALRGLSVNGQRQTMNNNSSSSGNSSSGNSNKTQPSSCEGTKEKMEGGEKESELLEKKRNKIKTLPPKSPKKTAAVPPTKSNNNNKKKQSKTSSNDDLQKSVNRSQSLGGYYNNANDKDKGSTGDLPISRKSSLSSLTSLINMSPRLFPRFGSKSGSARKRSSNSNVSLSPHRENACTNEFFPVETNRNTFIPADSSRTSSRCASPAPSECHSLPASGRCRSPDLLSTSSRFNPSSTSRINPVQTVYRPEMYLDPNQGKVRMILRI